MRREVGQMTFNLSALVALMPVKAMLEVITPRPEYGEQPYVIVHQNYKINSRTLDLRISKEIVEEMENLGLVEFDCTSGDDPELSARYDYYFVVV